MGCSLKPIGFLQENVVHLLLDIQEAGFGR